jgi:hypothetical protein
MKNPYISDKKSEGSSSKKSMVEEMVELLRPPNTGNEEKKE